MKRILLDKLKAKSIKCLFIGYPKETIGYHFYNSLEQKVLVSKHTVFSEKEFLPREGGSIVELEEIQDAQTNVDQLPEPKGNIHKDEIVPSPFEAQALHKSSKILTIIERLISH